MAARVLYVGGDDRRGEQDCACLREEHYEVTAASDAGACVETARRLAPQVVLIRETLAQPDALTLARHLRRQSETARSVIICITSSKARETLSEFAAGIDLQLPSAVERADLVQAVRAAFVRAALTDHEGRRVSMIDADLDAIDVAGLPTERLEYVARQPAAAVAPDPRGTILVVDDERAIRRLTESVLGRAGYTVVTKESAAEALEWWARHGNDVALVLTDVVMPGGTGPEMLATMRADRPDLGAIVMSGYMGEADLTASRSFDAFLQKPFTPDELRSAVNTRLAQAIATRS